MKILITGAGGMLGSDLAKALGLRFDVLGTGRRDAPHLTIRYFKADLSRAEAISSLWVIEKPQLIFHAAGMTHVDNCELDRKAALRDNLEATQNLVTASNRSHSLLIFFSTDYVFDGTKKGEYTEEDSPHPLNVYGESKLLAEKYIQQKSEQFLIFRLSWLYGLRGRSFPRTLLERAKTEIKFRIVCDQVGRPTYTRDIAEFFLDILVDEKNALERHKNQIFHLANEGTASWAEFGSFILNSQGGGTFDIDFVSSQEVKRPAVRPLNSVFSLDKVKKTFGLGLRHWREAARDFLQEYQQSKHPSRGIPSL